MAVLKCEKCGAMLKTEEGKFIRIIDYKSSIKNIDFSDIDILGVTAGASTPESLFNATSDI